MGFPGGSEGKASACNAGDLGLIPRWGRSPGEGNGNPLQYSLVNPVYRGFSLAKVILGSALARGRMDKVRVKLRPKR